MNATIEFNDKSIEAKINDLEISEDNLPGWCVSDAIFNIENNDDSDVSAHLEFYDEFDAYNSSWNYFKGFILSEVWIDGEPFYQLLNEEKDVKIIVDESLDNAVIYHNGNSMDYYMDFMITETTTHAELELCDITGDGEEELIISHIYGGTGFLDTICDVINLSSMAKYEIESYLNELSSRITVEPIEISDKSDLICRVSDVNGKIIYGTVPVFESAKLSDFSYDASEFNYIGNNSLDKCLTVSNGICLDDEGLYYVPPFPHTQVSGLIENIQFISLVVRNKGIGLDAHCCGRDIGRLSYPVIFQSMKRWKL